MFTISLGTVYKRTITRDLKNYRKKLVKFIAVIMVSLTLVMCPNTINLTLFSYLKTLTIEMHKRHENEVYFL